MWLRGAVRWLALNKPLPTLPSDEMSLTMIFVLALTMSFLTAGALLAVFSAVRQKALAKAAREAVTHLSAVPMLGTLFFAIWLWSLQTTGAEPRAWVVVAMAMTGLCALVGGAVATFGALSESPGCRPWALDVATGVGAAVVSAGACSAGFPPPSVAATAVLAVAFCMLRGWRTAAEADALLGPAPAAAVLMLTSRLIAVNENPVDGHPPGAVQAFFAFATACLLVAAGAADTAADPTRGVHAIAAGLHTVAMAAFYISMLIMVACCVSWSLPTTLACAVYLSAQYFVIHAYNFVGILLIGEMEAKDAPAEGDDPRVSATLCPALALCVLAARLRASQLSRWHGDPQTWVQYLAHVATAAVCAQLVLAISACYVDRVGGPPTKLRLARFACVVAAYSAGAGVLTGALALTRGSVLWQEDGAAGKFQDAVHAETHAFVGNTRAAPFTVGEFPLPVACPGPTLDTYFCDPEHLLSAKQTDAVREALGKFSAVVPCGAAGHPYRLGVVVASSLGIPRASFFKGEHYRIADKLYDRWKPSLTDEECATGALIILLTDLRYVLVRTGSCDYLTNDAAQRVVALMQADLDRDYGEGLAAGVRAMQWYLDSWWFAPAIGCVPVVAVILVCVILPLLLVDLLLGTFRGFNGHFSTWSSGPLLVGGAASRGGPDGFKPS